MMSSYGPIQERYREKMNKVAEWLDTAFNGAKRGHDREAGFVLLVFPFGDADSGRINYISNDDRRDTVIAFKEIVARFEGQADMNGKA